MLGRKTKLAAVTLVGGLCILGMYGRNERGIAGLPKSSFSCDVDVLAKPTLGDTRYQIVDVACDTLAKDETMRIYALASHKGWFGASRDEATLLFSFDPADSENTLPQLRTDPHGAIIISIPRVSSIAYMSDLWKGKPVLYEIGKIDDPHP